MFDNLTDSLSNSFKALQGKNKLSESNIKDAIREVRRALLAIFWADFPAFLRSTF
jgi:signal recognition particle subunit SRP54